MDSAEALDKALADAAREFGERARASRERGARALEGADHRDAFYARQARLRSRRHYDSARAWDARRREAERGYLLMTEAEDVDAEFLSTFADLIRACRAAGRCFPK